MEPSRMRVSRCLYLKFNTQLKTKANTHRDLHINPEA